MSVDVSRRTALTLGSAAVAVAGAGRAFAQDADPIAVVSTWDFGGTANAAALAKLNAGGSLLDAVEAGVRVPESDPENHSVGLGGYPDRDGHVTLDAVIMDDAGLLGSVAALEDIVHAISVARLVTEKTPHTMLVGPGARQFAVVQGIKPAKLLTPAAEKAWREWLKTAKYEPVANVENRHPGRPGSSLDHDTIGMLARGRDGRMAGACTTSGMAFKMRGRVGDSPLAGSGLYVERGIGGATATGVGEEVTRIVGTARVVASMRAGLSPTAACKEAVEHIARLRGAAIKEMQVGFLALSADGRAGGYALQPGFTFAITRYSGKTEIINADSFVRAPTAEST